MRAGLPEDTAGLDDFLSNVLGTASPHPLDMAAAYSTFAAQGVRHTPHIVASVTAAGSDEVVYAGPNEGSRVFDEDVMADTTAALQVAGYFGIWTYLAGNATNAPLVASFDNLSVRGQ